MSNTEDLRDRIAADALPIMERALLAIVKLLERELGGPMPQAGLIELGVRLDFVANGGVLLSALPEGAAPPAGMKRRK